MSLLAEGSSMQAIGRVIVGASRGAALGEISEFVDVDAMFAVSSESLDGAGDVGGSIDVLLAEGNDSSDLGVLGVEDADCVSAGVGDLSAVQQDWSGGGCQEGQSFSEHY